MKPPDRQWTEADLLAGPFVSIPFTLLNQIGSLQLPPDAVLVLLQILAAQQVQQRDFLTPQELSSRCGMSPYDVAETIGRLVEAGLLAIGVRLEADGTHGNYFDLRPLWTALRPKDPQPVQAAPAQTALERAKDVVTLFEEEFGRPLSGLECEQIRHWLEQDRHPEWMIVEALREAVLANKYSFKYIDRVLYDWQRHQIRSRADLEAYQAQHRERTRARDEAAAGKTGRRSGRGAASPRSDRDERYSAFYELFPDV
ncbi:DnaD domain protein [Alicyclobacillus sp.]|uniref:DnaD domain-containing protein n=1 Tax=Alicyclobacillus sp. TaxID=61169 RepID=UPI0025BBDAE7|nr:DnaD domain protein [Alicyclobacillus sp.]MCL6515512.1 DnaD domain protein [Alicyclobacillus sp.]